jgi:hypothetical protein
MTFFGFISIDCSNAIALSARETRSIASRILRRRTTGRTGRSFATTIVNYFFFQKNMYVVNVFRLLTVAGLCLLKEKLQLKRLPEVS